MNNLTAFRSGSFDADCEIVENSDNLVGSCPWRMELGRLASGNNGRVQEYQIAYGILCGRSVAIIVPLLTLLGFGTLGSGSGECLTQGVLKLQDITRGSSGWCSRWLAVHEIDGQSCFSAKHQTKGVNTVVSFTLMR